MSMSKTRDKGWARSSRAKKGVGGATICHTRQTCGTHYLAWY